MSSRPQPDPARDTPLCAFPSELWDRFLEFLLNANTGRVTVHLERGVVRMVETTVFSRQNTVDRKSDHRVESP